MADPSACPGWRGRGRKPPRIASAGLLTLLRLAIPESALGGGEAPFPHSTAANGLRMLTNARDTSEGDQSG